MSSSFLSQLSSSPYLRVKVTPKSPKNEITEIMEDETIKIRVKAPPEKGKANKELIKFLSQELNIPKNNIAIIAGKTEHLKLIKINFTAKIQP